MSGMNVLLLCGPEEKMAATVEDQLAALKRYSRDHYFRLPMRGSLAENLDLDRFDAVVVHYTLIACDDRYVSSRSRDRIGAFGGLKAMFIQDEYRFVNRTISAVEQMNIHVLFTCVPEGEMDKVYPSSRLPHVVKINVLTGYVPEYLLGQTVPSFSERTIDVGYRGRSVPAWFGELGQEKWRIGHRFAKDAKGYGLRCDIRYREEDRLYGRDWINFLTSCKAVLGVESGASVFDFTGDVQRQVEEHELRNPGSSFDELRDLYFKDLEGRIRLNQISPRSFECAALRTVMILYEGEYSGILKPWRHYLPMKKDHSNMKEIVDALRDPCLCEEIAENAYREIAENPQYSFRALVAKVDQAMHNNFRREMARKSPPLSEEEYRLVQRAQQKSVSRYQVADKLHRCLYAFTFRVLLFWASPSVKNRVHLRLRRYYRAGLNYGMHWLSELMGYSRG